MKPDLWSRIESAKRLINEPCGACKDCEDSCPMHVLKRILDGEPPTRCPICCEWYYGEVKYTDDGRSMEQIECPECAKEGGSGD